MTELVKILNNPEEHYPGNFDTPQRANALLTGLCQDAATEIERLTAEAEADKTIIEYHEATIERLKIDIALKSMAEPKIGCVNHDCDKCKAVQEPEYWNVVDPAGNIVASETDAIRGWARIAGSYKPTVEGLLGFHDQGWRVLPKVTSPAPQPVPVKTYHDGKPWPVAPVPNGPYSAPIKELWPVAPKPWVGLTADEMLEALISVDPETQRLPVGFSRFACAIEAKLKEKNT
jgi:hypothetical protein